MQHADWYSRVRHQIQPIHHRVLAVRAHHRQRRRKSCPLSPSLAKRLSRTIRQAIMEVWARTAECITLCERLHVRCAQPVVSCIRSGHCPTKASMASKDSKQGRASRIHHSCIQRPTLSGIQLVHRLGRNLVVAPGGVWDETWGALRDLGHYGGAIGGVESVGAVSRDYPVTSLVLSSLLLRPQPRWSASRSTSSSFGFQTTPAASMSFQCATADISCQGL